MILIHLFACWFAWNMAETFARNRQYPLMVIWAGVVLVNAAAVIWPAP